MKSCNACAEVKSLDDFYKHLCSSDGRAGICKDCHKLRMKTRRRENPAVQEYDRERAKQPHRREKAKKLVANWRKNFPAEYRAQTAINNAIRDGKLTRGRCGQCDADKNVFGIPADPSKPLERITWRCALCHHRGRFADVPSGTALIVTDTFTSKEQRA